MSFALPTFATRAVFKTLAFVRRRKTSSEAASSPTITSESKDDFEIITATPAPQVAYTPSPPAKRRRMGCKSVWSYKTDAAQSDAPRKRMSGQPVWFYKKPAAEATTSALPAITASASDDSFDYHGEVPVRRGGKRRNITSKATPVVLAHQALPQEQPLIDADDSFDYHGEVPVRRGGKRSKAMALQASRRRFSGQPVWFRSPRLVAEPDLIAFEKRRGSPVPSTPSSSSSSDMSSRDSCSTISSTISSASDCSQPSSLVKNDFFARIDSLPSWASGQLPSLINNDPL